MTRAIIGRWGDTLAVRVPREVERTLGLADGDAVEIESVDGSLLIKRVTSQTDVSSRAAEAARAMLADRAAYPLGDIGLGDLIRDGRRG